MFNSVTIIIIIIFCITVDSFILLGIRNFVSWVYFKKKADYVMSIGDNYKLFQSVDEKKEGD